MLHWQTQLLPSNAVIAILLSSSGARGVPVRQHFRCLLNLGLKATCDEKNHHDNTPINETGRGLPRGSVLFQEGCRHNGW